MATIELSDGGHAMLRLAVNAAREFQCRSVKELKERLIKTSPGCEAEINEAIAYWAVNVRASHPNGVPAY